MKKLKLKKILPILLLLIGYFIVDYIAEISIWIWVGMLVYAAAVIFLSHKKYGQWIAGGALFLNVAFTALYIIGKCASLRMYETYGMIEESAGILIPPLIILIVVAVAELVLIGLHIKNAVKKPTNDLSEG